MKPLLFLLFFFLGIIGCTPPNEVYIIQFVEKGDEAEPADPKPDKQLLLPAAESVDFGQRGAEVVRTTKDQIMLTPSLTMVEPSPDVTLIPPAGVVDLREIADELTENSNKRFEEMPYPGLPNRQVALVEMTKQELADKLGLEIKDIFLISMTTLEMPGDKLDCKVDIGGRRPMLVTFGYQITLEAAGTEYKYYAEPGGTPSFCEEG
jgi:hypothetical protein